MKGLLPSGHGTALISSALLALVASSCQGPPQLREPLPLASAERESGVSFVARRVGAVIRSPAISRRYPWDIVVGQHGVLHLFSRDLGYWLRTGIHYRKYESGGWTEFGSILDENYEHPFDAIQTPGGRLFLMVGLDRVLSGEGARWAAVHRLRLVSSDLAADLRGAVDQHGNLHIVYNGVLWPPVEKYRVGTRTRYPSKLFHARLYKGRWHRGRPTAGRARYEPRNFDLACGPGGRLYIVFEMYDVSLDPHKFSFPSLALSVYEKRRWSGPFRLPADGAELAAAGYVNTSIRVHFMKVASPGPPHIVVDAEKVCHLVWGTGYLQFRGGTCTAPWTLLEKASARALLPDKEGRLVAFLAQGDRLVARVRDERGWSNPFYVAEQAWARPILGGDSNVYLAWTEPVDTWRSKVCVQRIAFEEVRPSSP